MEEAKDCSKILDEITNLMGTFEGIHFLKCPEYSLNFIKLVISLENTNYKNNEVFLSRATQINAVIHNTLRDLLLNYDIAQLIDYCIAESTKGNSFANLILARKYLEYNVEAAGKYLILAADANNMFACNDLAHAYENGSNGFEVNPKKSYQYYKLASDQGCSEAGFQIVTKYIPMYFNDVAWKDELVYWQKNLEKFRKITLLKNNDPNMHKYIQFSMHIFGEYFKLKDEFKAHIEYMPDGPGYKRARTEFQEMAKN